MRCVRHQHHQRQLGLELDVRRRPAPAQPAEAARRRLDPHALEEGQRGREITRFEPVLRGSEREQLPSGRGAALGAAAPRSVPCCGAGSRPHRSRRGSRRCRSAPWPTPAPGEKLLARGCIGLPLHLHRVGHVEAFPGLVRSEQQEVRTGIRLGVAEPDRGSRSDDLVHVPRRDRLGPDRRARSTPAGGEPRWAGMIGMNGATASAWAHA